LKASCGRGSDDATGIPRSSLAGGTSDDPDLHAIESSTTTIPARWTQARARLATASRPTTSFVPRTAKLRGVDLTAANSKSFGRNADITVLKVYL
jgi:hypothetical protein